MKLPKSLLELRIKWQADRQQRFKITSKKRSVIPLSMGSEPHVLSPRLLRLLGL
jgi:hypothetical protein